MLTWKVSIVKGHLEQQYISSLDKVKIQQQYVLFKDISKFIMWLSMGITTFTETPTLLNMTTSLIMAQVSISILLVNTFLPWVMQRDKV